MNRDIIEKLNEHVGGGGIGSEAGVAYLLVQLAKLVERARQQGKYPHLMFYRNWAVHPRLDHTAFLIANFEQVMSQGKAEEWDDETIGRRLSEEMRTSLEGLRAEIRTAFASLRDPEHGTEFRDALRSDDCPWWGVMATLLLAILADIPLAARGNNITELLILERGPQHGGLRIVCKDQTFQVEFGVP